MPQRDSAERAPAENGLCGEPCGPLKPIAQPIAVINEFFQQFPLILGFQQVDWMSEQPSPLDPPAPPFGSNFVMELPLFTGFESMLEMAESQTATVEIAPVQKTQDGQLSSVVTVRNLTGHDLPTGVGFRRMFLQFLVLDKQGTTLWASGRTNELGFILDGMTDQVLESEQPVRFPGAPIQPHYQVINSGSQVQIYQELIRDSGGSLTTSFLRRVTPIKDNRIRPKGFDPRFFARSSSQYIRELAELHGEEAKDPYYVNPNLTGADKIEYRIPLDAPDAQPRRPYSGHPVLPVDSSVLSAGTLSGCLGGTMKSGRYSAAILHDQPSKPGRRKKRSR
jgi:hypothetical protein